MSKRIQRRLSALVLDQDGEIVARWTVGLVYDRRDPWAVTLTFPRDSKGDCTWTVARCLISEGLNQEMGDGDFRVQPGGGMVRVELISNAARLAVAFDIDEMEEFVIESFSLVPEGSERRHVDFDALIDALLGGVR